MMDTMVLERLEEALNVVPPAITPPLSDDLYVSDEFRRQANTIVANSRGWLANLKKAVMRARRHPEHASRSPEVWAQMEPTISRAIRLREKFIGDVDELALKARDLSHPVVDETLAILRRVSAQIVKEHRGLVEIYYMLKADADDMDEDTHGVGAPLSSPRDVKDYFKRILSA